MKNINKILKTALLACVAVLTFSCSTTNDNNEVIVPKTSILEIAKADPNLSILVAAIKKTGLDNPGSSPLSTAGSYTVFAPTNAAFASSTTYTLESINALTSPADDVVIGKLKQIVLNHILSGGVRSDDFVTNSYVKTFATGIGSSAMSMYITKTATDVILNGGSANLGAKVTAANISASNGIIHVVDKVILLPTLVSMAKANPDFSTLVTVLSGTATTPGTFGDQSAVLTALTGATPSAALTVYAPLNSAFAAATTGTGFLTGAVVTPANVTKVLQYHVDGTTNRVATATAFSATADITVTTLYKILTVDQKFFIPKNKLQITELPAITTVAPSNIKVTNVQTSNGIIHAIDRVLQPVL